MNNPPPERFHAPSMREEEESPGGGLYCFLDKERPCDVTCMAYIAQPDGPDYQDQQWANCLLLVNAHRGGKHLIVLASNSGELVKKAKNEAADRARAQQLPPPTVR